MLELLLQENNKSVTSFRRPNNEMEEWVKGMGKWHLSMIGNIIRKYYIVELFLVTVSTSVVRSHTRFYFFFLNVVWDNTV